MQLRFSILFLFFITSLHSAERRPSFQQDCLIAVREMQVKLEDMRHEMRNHQSEIRTFEEKLANQEVIIDALREQVFTQSKQLQNDAKTNISTLEMKIGSLDTLIKGLVSDLKELKTYSTETATSKLGDIEKTLHSHAENIESLKTALKSLMAILEVKHELKSSDVVAKVYRVQSGDTLEKIAKMHKTSIKAIKELNDFSSDRIVVGQNIKIP